MNTLAKLTLSGVLVVVSSTSYATETNADSSLLSDIKTKIAQSIEESIKTSLTNLKIETKQAVTEAMVKEAKQHVENKDRKDD
ncbi:hypothetical protein ACSLBF_11715 [Pseudoalteromonas sp. T1lg65]|uniref:hypothetical protein n=1 Tax=Pseudoalteromonas sp. T1lg65 TaxID=2077101 RepID=UPI003F7AD985